MWLFWLIMMTLKHSKKLFCGARGIDLICLDLLRTNVQYIITEISVCGCVCPLRGQLYLVHFISVMNILVFDMIHIHKRRSIDQVVRH